MAFKRAQNCSNRLSNLRETDVSSWRASLKITYPVISPEPEAAAMIHLHLICSHILAFKPAQDCLNRLSHIRKTGADTLCVDGYITYSIISPEPEVATVIRLNLINGIVRAFK